MPQPLPKMRSMIPWLVTSLDIMTSTIPSNSLSTNTITINATEPNELYTVLCHITTCFLLSSNTSCTITWTGEEPPYGQEFNCTTTRIPASSMFTNWTAQLVKPSDIGQTELGNDTKFDIKLNHFNEFHRTASVYWNELGSNFTVETGVNLDTVCTSDGICKSSLMESLKPMNITQEMEACQTMCSRSARDPN
jgi:hypothetical protein